MFDMTSYALGQKSAGGGSGGGTGDVFVYIDDPTATQNFKPSDILDDQLRLKKVIIVGFSTGSGHTSIMPEVFVVSFASGEYMLSLLLATDPEDPLKFSANTADDYFAPYHIT